MRAIAAAILLILTMLGAARADADFSGEAQYQWKLQFSRLQPVPVPKGWSIDQTEAKVAGKNSNVLKGLPPGASWGDGWIDTGFLAWRFGYGAPSGSTRDTLHLTMLKLIAAGSENLDLRAWEELDGIRASLHAISGPDGQEEYNLILSHWGSTVNIVSVFAKTDEWESASVQAYAGKLMQALTGVPGIAEKVAALDLEPRTPPQQEPYAMAAETKSVTWYGRTIHVPKDWQVTRRPIDAALAEGLSIWIKAAPNLDDEDAPQLQYARWSASKGEPIDFLKQLIEAAKIEDPSFETARLSRIGSVACVHGFSKGERVSKVEGFGCVGRSDLEGTTIVEYVGFEAPKDQFERLGGKRLPLFLTKEVEPDVLDETLTIALDKPKRLLTTRQVPPFPPLVPLGEYRVPPEWDSELSFLDGEIRFLGPMAEDGRPILAYRARTDTGTDAEIALTNLIEDYAITDFALDYSDYLDGVQGLIAVGTGVRDGAPIKLAAFAEKDHPAIFVFMAPPKQFDEMGGAALLAPVFLRYPPDSFEATEDPRERVARIAKAEGERIAKEREEARQLKIWQKKMEAQSMMNAYHSLSMAIACGGWC